MASSQQHFEPEIIVNIFKEGRNGEISEINDDFFSQEESELGSIVMEDENNGWFTIEKNKRKRYRTESEADQDVNRKCNNKEVENIFSLADSNMEKVDANKSNATTFQMKIFQVSLSSTLTKDLLE